MPTKIEQLALLQKENQNCIACPLAKEGRSSIVFGTGPIESRLFFVGEAPGAEEDRLGMPFVGRAGHLLRTLLQEALPTETPYFLSNAVKCRPLKNRTPLPTEITCCSTKILIKEIEIIQPRIIVALGKSALFALTKETDTLAHARKNQYHFQSIPVIATYHPAFCVRFPKWSSELKKDILSALKRSLCA